MRTAMMLASPAGRWVVTSRVSHTRYYAVDSSAHQLASMLACRCDLPELGLPKDTAITKMELLLVEALTWMHVQAKGITARGHFHLRRMFGREDDPGPGATLPVLADTTIRESYVPSSSRFLLMAWRQSRAEGAGLWRGPPLSSAAAQALATLARQLGELADQLPRLTVGEGNDVQHPFLQGDPLKHEDLESLQEPLLHLLVALYHTRLS